MDWTLACASCHCADLNGMTIASMIATLVTVEPRLIGSGHTLIFQFNAPVSPPATTSVMPSG